MGDLTFLAAAYAIFWLVAFAFIYSMVSRMRTLAKDLEMLEKLADQDGEGDV